MLVARKTIKKPPGTSIKIGQKSPPQYCGAVLWPKMPIFWAFFGIGNAFLIHKHS
jgi:hypothetical protein